MFLAAPDRAADPWVPGSTLVFGIWRLLNGLQSRAACSMQRSRLRDLLRVFHMYTRVYTYIYREITTRPPPPRVIGYCDRSGPSHVSGINNLALEEEWSTHESGAGHRERSRRRLYYGTRTGIDYQRSASHLQGASGSSMRGPTCNTTFQKHSCITAV